MTRENRRTPDQIKSDRALIAQWHYQGYTDQDIAEKLRVTTGSEISRRQVNTEITHLRKSWLARQEKSYDQKIAEEMHRLDVLEQEVWRAMRASAGERTKKTIEEIARKLARNAETLEEESQYEMFTHRILTTIEAQDVNPAYFDKILNIQIDRRKLMGLYPSTGATNNVQINVIKGYDTAVSPSDWPDHEVVDGDFHETKSLPASRTE